MRVYLALRANQNSNDTTNNNSSSSSSSSSEQYQNSEGDEIVQSYQIIEYPSDQEDSIVQQHQEEVNEEEEVEVGESYIYPETKGQSQVQEQHDSFKSHQDLIASEPTANTSVAATADSIDSTLTSFQPNPNTQNDCDTEDCKVPFQERRRGEKGEIRHQNDKCPTELLGKRKAISLEYTNVKKEQTKDCDYPISSCTKPFASLPVSKRLYSYSFTRNNNNNSMGLPRSLGDYYSSQLKSSDSTNESGTHLDPEFVAREQSYPEREDIMDDEAPSDHTTESFILAMKKRGLEVVEQEGDGNCLFRAVSLQVYGDSDSHMDVRRRCLDFMAKDEAHFAPFIQNESFHDYIRRKRKYGVHGNNVEIQAISELYNRPVEVFIPNNGSEPINIFQSDYKTSDIPIRLSYHDGNHYNAVIDPLIPTAGLGLGLPNLEPGLADKLQMQQAVDESTKLHEQKLIDEAHEKDIQLAIKESLGSFHPSSTSTKKAAASSDYWSQKKAAMGFQDDLHETDFELEQSALLSSMDLHRMEGSRKPSSENGASSTSNERRRSSCSRTNSPVQNDHHEESSNAPPFASSYASSSIQDEPIPSNLLQEGGDEYPQVVQELVMNGFALSNVLKAYDLIGDNFDNLLSFLMSTSGE